MNDKLKKLALNRKVESGSIGNTMHVVLLLCNGACNVNKGCIYKKSSTLRKQYWLTYVSRISRLLGWFLVDRPCLNLKLVTVTSPATPKTFIYLRGLTTNTMGYVVPPFHVQLFPVTTTWRVLSLALC